MTYELVLLITMALPLAVVAVARRKQAASAWPRVVVLVLGDFGRSPRMQYHALSLAAHACVSVVAFAGTAPLPALVAHPRVTMHLLPPPYALRAGLPRICFLLFAPLKVLWQVLQLVLYLVVIVPTPRVVLVQNPPSIPALPVAWVAARLRGARLVVDWHNYGFTILQLGLRAPATYWLVRLAHWIEFAFGRRADAHLCVTHAMAWDLHATQAVTGAPITVLHDRPAAMFGPTPLPDVHRLFAALMQTEPGAALRQPVSPAAEMLRARDTLLTTTAPRSDGGEVVSWRAGRPALLVSATSWTDDEDFGLLLTALQRYDEWRRHDGNAALPDILCIITGKGPRREAYIRQFAAAALVHVRVLSLWLAVEDYPRLLGAADLGVCLHKSSSGLDLPMKVVDMFGSGLPVCAVDFPWYRLAELVHNNTNGRVFATGLELAEHLRDLLHGPRTTLATYRANLASFRLIAWTDNWTAAAAPCLLV